MTHKLANDIMNIVELQKQLEECRAEKQRFSKLSKERKKKVAHELGTSPKAHERNLAANMLQVEGQLRKAQAGSRRLQHTVDASDDEGEVRSEKPSEDDSEDGQQSVDAELDGALLILLTLLDLLAFSLHTSIDMSVLTPLTRSPTRSPTPFSLEEGFDDEKTISLTSAIDSMNVDSPPEDGPMMLSAAGTKVRQNLLPDVVRRFNQSFRLWSSQSNGEITTAMAEAATTLHKSVVFVSKALDISLSDAEWPIQHSELQFYGTDVNHIQAWMACQAFSVELPTFWDHNDQTQKVLTRTVASTALSQQGAHIGIVEAGRETALHVFLNQANKRKCLSCSKGPRGKSASKKALSQRGSGPGYLDCNCPEDDALLLLWLYKISAAHDVPKVETAPELHSGVHKLDFHPLNLPYVAAGIRETSGLGIDDLLRPRANRLACTLSWSAHEFAREMDSNSANELHTIIKALDTLLDNHFA
ncbi:hypothetical protein EWM64_g7953 [Hericium alpestre]|uniref:Uncharacterized protein n=1 Tax=Hericium alpestre TaxID=135208 RepID=A0A4Y9ZRF1_9AGAM|nr:hypothetical protein EWM64_g7953 [Hericium alpestre]